MNVSKATNGAGLSIRLSPWLERVVPTTRDFAMYFQFLCAVNAKLPIRVRYDLIDIIFFQKLLTNLH